MGIHASRGFITAIARVGRIRQVIDRILVLATVNRIFAVLRNGREGVVVARGRVCTPDVQKGAETEDMQGGAGVVVAGARVCTPLEAPATIGKHVGQGIIVEGASAHSTAEDSGNVNARRRGGVQLRGGKVVVRGRVPAAM